MTQLSRERLEALANIESLECMALPASQAEAAEMARRLLAVEGQEQTVCPKCSNTGLTDSGGTYPWGEGILVPCDCSLPDPELTQLVHDLNIDGNHRLANVIQDLIAPLYAAPQPVAVPETLPCPVLLEPGMRFGKGVRTQTMLDALNRRADHYAKLEAMTAEQHAEREAGIQAFAAMLQPSSGALQLPDGWKLVPVELTCEMDDAAWDAYHDNRCMSDIYAAMLAAAPQEPAK